MIKSKLEVNMNNTRWIYKENIINDELRELNLDKDILNILINRKIDSKEKISHFFDNSMASLQSPFLLKDVEKTINRILTAIENNEKIYIYGDYDVDGITSTSISYLALKELKANIHYYIPLRDEGYGLNNDALSQIRNEGGTLVISVDCGISSIKEANHAKEIGIDLVITDHHEITGELPDAYAIINPKLKDQEYSFQYLAGCGTVYLLLLALYDRLGRKTEMYKYVDIAAIGTIADIVPLVEENRTLSKNGLEKLKNTENIGLSTLLPLIFEDYKNHEYNSYDVGFLIAPIFNAAGRLEDAKRAVELFVTPSKEIAHTIALKLIEQNNERKELQKDILEAVEKDISIRDLQEKHVIVSASSEFHHGVIGIVASKIVDKYYKPTIIMEIKEKDGFAVASCRSIEGFHILEGLNSMKEIFIKYGGHAGAAGFSIPIDKIAEFEERMNEYAKNTLEEESYLKPIHIDKEILFNKISYGFFNKLEELKPFGFGNSNPTFSVNKIKLSNTRQIGKDKSHLMTDINGEGLTIRNCVWFGNGHEVENLNSSSYYDVAFKPKIELYNDKYYPKVFIEDICLSEKSMNETEKLFELHDTAFPMETVIYSMQEASSNDKLELVIKDNKAQVLKNGRVFSFVEDGLAFTLNRLVEYYNFKFKCEFIACTKSTSNYQIKIIIDKDMEFKTLSFRDSDLFKDIKDYLLGSLPYNSLQRSVLSKVFKENKNIILENSKNRGIKTIINTIALYYKAKEKKVLIITSNASKFLETFYEVSDSYKEFYDFYIFYDFIPENLPEKFIVISENADIPNIEKISGEVTLPQSINIVSENDLLEYEIIYSNKLPINKKLDIIKNMGEYSAIYCTSDIYKVL